MFNFTMQLCDFTSTLHTKAAMIPQNITAKTFLQSITSTKN